MSIYCLFIQQEFVQGLSILSRGSLEEKLRWAFSLYDINGDGYVTRNEMTDIVTSIYELMGRNPESNLTDVDLIKMKVDSIFSVSLKIQSIARPHVNILNEICVC